MKRCLATVHLSDLNWLDRSFAIESFVRPAFLLGSLERHGVLTHPWLLQTEDDRPVVVDGFKRLKWLQENGTVEVECLLYESDSDRRSLTLQRLEAKMVDAVLNLAEKAQIVAKLAGLMPAETCVSGVSHRYMWWPRGFRLRQRSRRSTTARRVCGSCRLELETFLGIRAHQSLSTPSLSSNQER